LLHQYFAITETIDSMTHLFVDDWKESVSRSQVEYKYSLNCNHIYLFWKMSFSPYSYKPVIDNDLKLYNEVLTKKIISFFYSLMI